MEIVIANKSDADRWNEYVNRHAHASPYHSFAWKQSIESAYHQQGHYLMALNNQNQISGILPTILIKPPLGKYKLCSLPYCDRGEALADSPEIIELLISEANKFRLQNNVHSYEYRATKLKSLDTIDKHTYPHPQKVRMILALPETSEVLLASFKAKLRSQIKKAEKNGLTFEVGNNESLISDFYHIFTINMRDLGSPTHSKCWFENISRYYANNCIISIVKHGSTAISAGLILTNGKTATVPWASTLRKYNKLAPNMMLYWSLLRYATDHGFQQFDFGRSNIGEGTFKFKKQWGAKPVELDWRIYSDHFEKEPEIGSSVDSSPLRQMAEAVWKKLPLPLTIQLGSRVRKYISL